MASTLSKIRNAIGAISDGEVVTFGSGFVAVHPRHLAALRQQFGAQSQYIRWLDQGLVVDMRYFNPDDRVYVVRRSTDDQGASTLDRCITVVQGGALQKAVGDGENLSANAVGISAATQSAEVLSFVTTQWGADTGADVWGLTWYVRKSLGRPVGPLMSISATRVQGGVPRSAMGFQELGRNYWGRVVEPRVVAELPAGFDAWPLIVGPAVLTRAEVYPNLEWCVVEAAQLALRLEATLVAMPAAERVKATAELNKLKAMGRDLLGWANIGSINPYSLVPAFSNDADALIASRDTIDGKNWGEVNDRLRSMAGKRANMVCGFEDDLDPEYDASDGAGLPAEIHLTMDDSGVVQSNTTLYLAASGWIEVAPRLRRIGKSFVVMAPGKLSSPDIRSTFDQLVGACTGAITPMGDSWSSTRGEQGAIGLGLIGTAANPLTASMNQLINVFLTPGFMDVERP